MKTILIIAITIIAMGYNVANAQPYTNTDKKIIYENLDSLLYKYMTYSTLTKAGETKLKIKDNLYIIESFKFLFTKDAQIFDDINAYYNEKTASYECEIKTSRDKYWRALIDSFPTGLKINNLRINVNYNKVDQGVITAALERNIEGMSQSGYNFYNHDTLLLTMLVQKDLSLFISKVESLGSNIICKNDKDNDGVTNPQDDCPDDAGVIALRGCPDSDKDGFADKDDDCDELPWPTNNGCPPSTFAYRFVLSAHLGYQINNNDIKMPSFDAMKPGMDLDKSTRSNAGTSKAESDFKARDGFNVGAYVAYFIGRNSNNRNKGIALGINYISYSVDYNIKDARYEYKDTLNNVDGLNGISFRRIVSIGKDGLVENAKFNIYNFPLLFKIKTKFSTKWAGELSAGPSFLIANGTAQPKQGQLKVEGIFQYKDGAGMNGFPYEYTNDYSATGADTTKNIFITNGSSSYYFEQTPSDLYNSLNNSSQSYAFGQFGVGAVAATKFRLTGFGLNFMADAYYHLTPRFALRIGGSFVYGFLKSKTGGKNYELLTRQINVDVEKRNAYRSIFEGNSKANYTAYGFYTGIVYGF